MGAGQGGTACGLRLIADMDYVTALCSQVVYEGLVDDTFRIKCGRSGDCAWEGATAPTRPPLPLLGGKAWAGSYLGLWEAGSPRGMAGSSLGVWLQQAR